MKKVMDKIQEEKGITLIALVITIIVLIILAGISIQLLLGENGIITKAKKGKGDYEESAVREKVEMALVDYNSDKITKGEEGEIAEALNKLLDNNTFDDIEIEENIGIVDDYEITLGKEKGEVIIEGIDKVTGSLRLRCKLSTREYTKDGVTIKVKATGNIEKVIKADNKEVEAINGQIEFDYPVSTNGNYVFKAQDAEGNSIEKTVIVDNIDTLPPKDFTINAKAITGSGFTIIGQAEDTEATETSACSGINRYEYFVKKITDENYPDEPYQTNEITNLTQGTYQVYVVAYDKAGNSKQSGTIEVKITIKIAKVAAGSDYALMIDEEGNLYAVGYNDRGQLGDGTTTNRTTPVRIKEGTKFKEVVAGAYRYTLAIDIEGNLWGWGYNENGQLGDGTSTSRNSPVPIKAGTKFKEVATGGQSSCAIDEDGNLWMWGTNRNGQLGDGTTTNQKSPIQIKKGEKFTKVAMGYTNSYAIDEAGNLWGCGHGGTQLGDGGTTTRKSLVQIKAGTKFKEISVGSIDHCKYAIDIDGNLWGWGPNEQGQLGDGTSTSRNSPVQIKAGTKFKKIAMCVESDVNVGYSLAIDEDGNLWASGRNTGDGVLGNNSTVTSKTQVQIKPGTKFKEIAASKNNSYAIDEEGNLWAWGNNSYGQLANGTTTGSKVPIQAF